MPCLCFTVAIRASESAPAASDSAPAIEVDSLTTAPALETRQTGKKKSNSSWNAKAANADAKDGEDYLYEVGRSDVSMNVDTAQNSVHLDSLFTGNFLGHKSDIADGSLRGFEFRKFENIQGDYYISPRFLSAVTVRFLPDTHLYPRPAPSPCNIRFLDP